MSYCEQCGSATRDKDGFCGGCGARWPLPQAAPQRSAGSARNTLPAVTLPGRMGFIGFEVARPRQVWIAVVLAIFGGPLGLFYCTTTGAIVMLVVSIPLQYFLGYASLLIVLPICTFWAWRAARELSGITG